jgi:hypothetical protein
MLLKLVEFYAEVFSRQDNIIVFVGIELLLAAYMRFIIWSGKLWAPKGQKSGSVTIAILLNVLAEVFTIATFPDPEMRTLQPWLDLANGIAGAPHIAIGFLLPVVLLNGGWFIRRLNRHYHG